MGILDLFLTFTRIGLFGFGGGYAMIPLIQREIISHDWLNPAEFADIVAVSQMTPGPIAVNAATFIGFRTYGVFGGILATIGLVVPSLVIIVIAGHMIEKFKSNRVLQAALSTIRPAAIGMIGSAVMFFASMSVFAGDLRKGEFAVHWQGVVILLVIGILSKRFKVHPIYCVIISAALGVLLFVFAA